MPGLRGLWRRLWREAANALPAYIVLVVGLLSTFALYSFLDHSTRAETRARQSVRVQLESENLRMRFHLLSEDVRALASFVAVQRIVEATTWRNYTDKLLLDRASGVRRIALYSLVNNELSEIVFHEADVRIPSSYLRDDAAEIIDTLQRARSTKRTRATNIISDQLVLLVAPVPGRKELYAGIIFHFEDFLMGLLEERSRPSGPQTETYTEVISLSIGGVRRNVFYDMPVVADESRVALIAGGLGLIATLGLFLGGRALIVSRRRATVLARRMTAGYRAATARANQANLAKTEFLARMSHEIRTPLNAIIGITELLERGSLNEEQENLVNLLQISGENLMHLINDVLDLARIESGMLEIESEDFGILSELESQIQLYRLRAEEKGLWLRTEIGPEIPAMVRGDGNRVRQILANLIGNAIKFTEEGGITVFVQRLDQDAFEEFVNVHAEERVPVPKLDFCILFSVTDTGPGIPPNRHTVVFEEFTQADTSTQRSHGGSGLGLAICRRLCDRMGGAIALQSEPGRGSRFVFVLPFAESVAGGERGGTVLTKKRPSGKSEITQDRVRVLVAEDVDVNRLLMQAFLRDQPYHVEIVNDGQEALDAYENNDYDIMVLDLEMPRMDGYGVARAVRQAEAESDRKRTTLIALTAHAMEEVRAQTMIAGFDHFLTKPVRRKEVLEALHSCARSDESPAD